MIDIRILGVPYSWREFVAGEVGSSDNTENIMLIHEPTGISYRVKAPQTIDSGLEAATLRAKAKLKFIHELHGESWLNE